MLSPTGAGVYVPDRTVKWYSVNNDITLDGMLAAYRGRAGSGEIFVANFAGQGDYMGRYYGYQRPAGATGGTTRCFRLVAIDHRNSAARIEGTHFLDAFPWRRRRGRVLLLS